MAASSVVFTLTPESNSEGAVLRDFVAAYRAWVWMQGIWRSLVSALSRALCLACVPGHTTIAAPGKDSE
jgi:hypothetical protein